MNPWSERLGQSILRHPRRVWAVALLSTVLCASGLSQARFSTDYRIFFSDTDPELKAFVELEKVFTRTDNVLFVVHSPDGQLFNTSALTAIQTLTEASWMLPHATRVDSLSNLQHSYEDNEELIVESLLAKPAQKLSESERKTIKSIASQDALLRGSLLSQDLKAAGINVLLQLPRDDPQAVVKTAEAARALLARTQAAHPELEMRVSGMALMNHAFMEASIQDMAQVLPVMFLVMVLALAFLLRSLKAVAAIGVVVAMASAMTLGVGGWLGYPLTPVSASAPTIVLTLAVADGVHLIVSVRRALAEGLKQKQAILRSMQGNLRPIFLTSLTTLIGFLCLNFAEAPPYAHLANTTAVGIVAAFSLALTLLPVMLLKVELTPSAEKHSAFWASLARRTLASPVMLLIAGGLLTAAATWSALRLEANDNFVEYFDDSIAFRPDTDFVMDKLSGIYSLELRIHSGSPQGVLHPEHLEHLDEFSRWLKSQDEVEHVYSFSDIVKRIHLGMEGSAEIPKSKALTSQLLLVYEMSLPPGKDLRDRLDVDKESSRVTITVKNLTSREMREFKDRVEGWLVSNTPEPMHGRATSPVVIFSHLSDRNTKSMMKGNLLSLLLISLLLVFALGSPRLGVLSLVPNLLPLVLGYGLWSALFSEINIVASVAGTVCLGIIVDDTIHFLSRYQRARAEGEKPEDAVRLTLERVGPALVVTTVVLLLGFGVLTQSGFQMNQYLGLLTVFVVGFALMADLLLLPALLVVTERQPQEQLKWSTQS